MLLHKPFDQLKSQQKESIDYERKDLYACNILTLSFLIAITATFRPKPSL